MDRDTTLRACLHVLASTADIDIASPRSGWTPRLSRAAVSRAFIVGRLGEAKNRLPRDCVKIRAVSRHLDWRRPEKPIFDRSINSTVKLAKNRSKRFYERASRRASSTIYGTQSITVEAPLAPVSAEAIPVFGWGSPTCRGE